jgi:hypothetical protein
MLHTDKTKTVQELFNQGCSIESILFDRMNWALLNERVADLKVLVSDIEEEGDLEEAVRTQFILDVLTLFQDVAVGSGYVQEKTVFAERKFEVTVQVVITKTFCMQAGCKEEAEEIARERFSIESQKLEQDVEEVYEFECLRVDEWSCDEALKGNSNEP